MATKSTKTNKKTTAKKLSLSKFLSVVTKPELCGTTKYFSKDKRTGKYHAVCPIAKAAVKRGLRFNGGGSPVKAISKKFNIPESLIRTFTNEWDNRIGSLKHDHVPSTLGFHKGNAAAKKVKLTTHEMRTAFRQAVKNANAAFDVPVLTCTPVSSSTTGTCGL